MSAQWPMPRRGAAFRAGLGLTLGVTVLLVAPMLLSVVAGFERDLFTGLAGGFTLAWVGEVFTDYAGSIGLTVLLAVLSLVVTVVIGVPGAYGLELLPQRWARVVRQVLVLPLAIPGLTLALAIVQAYSAWTQLRQGIMFILAGHVLVTLPLMVGAVSASLKIRDIRTLEEGAASLGATRLQRLRDIVLPVCQPGIVAGGLQVLAISIGEFNLTWLLHTPLHPTLPTALADAYATRRLELASAFTGVFFLLVMPLLLGLQKLSRHIAPVEEMTP